MSEQLARNEIHIEGLDLKIDSAVHQICVTSNATSSSTRSVMYIMVLVSILSLIAVMNTLTHNFNWTEQRIEDSKAKISNYRIRLNENKSINKLDSISIIEDSLEWEESKLQSVVRNKIENIQTVKTPILGNAFDVNNLGIISGITIMILMSILYVTVKREINNLIIAFHSISQRYVPAADENTEAFVKFLEKEPALERRLELLREINRTRRWHHYYFLSMNEVFNMPPNIKKDIQPVNKIPVEKSEGNKERSIIYKMWQILVGVYKRPVDGIFFIPFLVYTAIFCNDISTMERGNSINTHHTLISTFCSAFFLLFILVLSFICTSKKIRVFKLYDNFSLQDCTFNNVEEHYESDRVGIKNFVLFLIIIAIAVVITYLISFLKS